MNNNTETTTIQEIDIAPNFKKNIFSLMAQRDIINEKIELIISSFLEAKEVDYDGKVVDFDKDFNKILIK